MRRRLLLALLTFLVLAPAVLAGLIAFGTAAPPPPLTAIIDPFRKVDFSDVPKPVHIAMRDGLPLSVHVYEASPKGRERVAIALHGSSGFGASLHPLSKALRDAGITVYAPDLRGHGASGRRGDIDYAGQLDDDLADLTAAVRAAHPKAELTLIGFSAGGGLALRASALPVGREFASAVLLSPMLGVDAPTTTQDVYRWARPYIPRIVGLTVLDALGIHTFDGLPVLAFAVPADPKDAQYLAPFYSFRMLMTFGTADYAADLRNAHCPLTILIGGADELFAAGKLAATVHAVRKDVPVRVLPGLGHVEMTLQRAAFDAIIAAIEQPRA